MEHRAVTGAGMTPVSAARRGDPGIMRGSLHRPPFLGAPRPCPRAPESGTPVKNSISHGISLFPFSGAISSPPVRHSLPCRVHFQPHAQEPDPQNPNPPILHPIPIDEFPSPPLDRFINLTGNVNRDMPVFVIAPVIVIIERWTLSDRFPAAAQPPMIALVDLSPL
jgi:hypothetical protein